MVPFGKGIGFTDRWIDRDVDWDWDWDWDWDRHSGLVWGMSRRLMGNMEALGASSGDDSHDGRRWDCD